MNRKVLKERGLNVLKTHYWIIVLIMAFTSFIGVENASSFGSFKKALSREVSLDSDGISNTILDEKFGGVADVFQYITSGFGSQADRAELVKCFRSRVSGSRFVSIDRRNIYRKMLLAIMALLTNAPSLCISRIEAATQAAAHRYST